MAFLPSLFIYLTESIMTQAINSNTVAQYLVEHPDFFETHADILSGLRLTSPVIGKTVSLHERQIEVLRSKHKALELQLSRLMHAAQANKTLMEKILDWTCPLLKEQNDAAMPQTVVSGLQSVFGIPAVTLRLWNIRPEYADSWFTQHASEDIRNAANGMGRPYCGKVPENQEAVKWLDRAAEIRSVAIVPLKTGPESLPFGLLVMGSPDATRFQNDMATDFLDDIGKLASAALDHLRIIG